MIDIKLAELIGFFQIFFRNDIKCRIKRIGLDWVSDSVPLSEICNTELYKVYKKNVVRSFGFCIDSDCINISV